MKALIIEDAPELVESIRVCIALRWPYSTVAATGNGRDAVPLARRGAPDIVILDLGLRDFDGFEVLREIRRVSDVPIAIVSARDDEVSKVKALELGADDYIVKPFSHAELLARIKALLRRSRMPQLWGDSGVVNGGSLVVDLAAWRVFVDGREVELTPLEWNLLSYLVRNEGRIISQDVLTERVWGTPYIGRAAVKMCVRRLRAKLGDDGKTKPRVIRSHRGRGYSLVVPRG